MLEALGKKSSLVIATGGGCVTRPENHSLLHQNATLFWLTRDLELLPSEGRPLSQTTPMEEMYRRREPLYRQFAHHIIPNRGTPEEAAAAILAKLEESV